jgi:hypothetical protein
MINQISIKAPLKLGIVGISHNTEITHSKDVEKSSEFIHLRKIFRKLKIMFLVLICEYIYLITRLKNEGLDIVIRFIHKDPFPNFHMMRGFVYLSDCHFILAHEQSHVLRLHNPKELDHTVLVNHCGDIKKDLRGWVYIFGENTDFSEKDIELLRRTYL